MFPLTHVLTARTLLESSQHQVVLGGIFPDLGNTVGLNRQIAHEMGTGFLEFCRERNRGFLYFAWAIITHGSKPNGLDYFADEYFNGQAPGYCFQRAVPLVDKVITACALPPEMGLWKAHNFVEMAYEVIAVERYPFLSDLVLETLNDRVAISGCAEVLGQYFNVDISRIGATFRNLPGYFCLSGITPVRLAEKYAVHLKERHQITGSNVAAMAEIIEEAAAGVRDEFDQFLGCCFQRITEMITILRAADDFPGR